MYLFLGSGLGYICHEVCPNVENIEQFKRDIEVPQRNRNQLINV
jgi:hypothetical protein